MVCILFFLCGCLRNDGRDERRGDCENFSVPVSPVQNDCSLVLTCSTVGLPQGPPSRFTDIAWERQGDGPLWSQL